VLDLFADGPVDQAERIGIDYDRRRLQRLGERARALAGPKEDWNLRELVEIIRRLLGMTTARLSFPASYRRQNTSRLSCPSS
jgi:hypothetical protein